MKILTLNTWRENGPWKERWQVIFDGLHKLQPDVIGFQEIFDAAWEKEAGEKMGRPFRYFSDPQSGHVIWSKHPIAEKECLMFKTQSPHEDYRRYATYALLEIGRKKERLAFFVTHLSWMLDDGPVREKQADELLAFIQKKAAGVETVAVGDFNAPPSTPEIRKMIREGGFTDVFEKMNPGSAAVTWDNRNPFAASAHHSLPDRRIDYLFIRNAGPLLGNLKRCRIVFNQPGKNGLYATDHYGVLATFDVGADPRVRP